MLITHDLGVVAGFCDETLVLYGGRIMERANTKAIFAQPSHPYTRGLMRAVPNIHAPSESLQSIPGQPPNQLAALTGCPFAERCNDAITICTTTLPDLTQSHPMRACIRPIEDLT